MCAKISKLSYQAFDIWTVKPSSFVNTSLFKLNMCQKMEENEREYERSEKKKYTFFYPTR